MLRKEDGPKHQGLRRKLIEELRTKEPYDAAVLNAMAEIPRHFFLDPVFVTQAYSDTAFHIGAGQTISSVPAGSSSAPAPGVFPTTGR